MTKLKIIELIFLSCLLGALAEEQKSEAQSKIDHFLKPPDKVPLLLSPTQFNAQPKEEPSFFSKVSSWIFPFGGTNEQTDSLTAQTQQRYAPQYLPPPPSSHGYSKQPCNPCNKEPWIPVVSTHGHNTVVGFVHSSELGNGGHISPSNSYVPPPNNLQNLHPPPLGGNYGPPSPQYGAPPPQYIPPPAQHPPPSPQYGPPSPQYGPPSPQYGPPSPQYGPPSPQYGAPALQDHLGPPPLPQKRPPLSIHPQYGVPKDQFGFSTNVKPHFGLPPENFRRPVQYFTPPPSKYSIPPKQGPPKHGFPPFKHNGVPKSIPPKFKQRLPPLPPPPQHGPPIPLNFGKPLDRPKPVISSSAVESFPSLSLEFKPPNNQPVRNYAPIRGNYHSSPSISHISSPVPNYHAPSNFGTLDVQHVSPLPFYEPLSLAPINLDQNLLSGGGNPYLASVGDLNLGISAKPIPFPEVSFSQVGPLRNAGSFHQNNFGSTVTHQSSHKGESAHDIQVIPSIRVADYLASVEHPINVIQSPIVEVTATDNGQTAEPESVGDYGSNKIQFNENPIVVESHEDDTHAAATAQNISYHNQNLNANIPSPSYDILNTGFSSQGLKADFPVHQSLPPSPELPNSGFSDTFLKPESSVQSSSFEISNSGLAKGGVKNGPSLQSIPSSSSFQSLPSSPEFLNSGFSDSFLKSESSVQSSSFEISNSGLAKGSVNKGPSVQSIPSSSLGVLSSGFSSQGLGLESFTQNPVIPTPIISNLNPHKENFKAEPFIQSPSQAHAEVPSNSFSNEGLKFAFDDKKPPEEPIILNSDFLDQFLHSDFSQTPQLPNKQNQSLFTPPPMDYSNWTPTLGELSTSMVPPPLGEPVWLTATAAGQHITSTTKKPKQVQIIIPYTSNHQQPLLPTNPDYNKLKPAASSALPLYTQPPPASQSSVWAQYTSDYNKEGSNKVTVTATTRRPTVVSNIRDLLLKEGYKGKPNEPKISGSLKNLPFDIVRLQKNIDDWTEQEFSNSILNIQNPSTSGKLVPSKNIPSEYLTTQPYNASALEVTTIRNLPDGFYDHEPAGSDTKILKVESNEDIDTNFIITETTPYQTSTTTEAATTTTPVRTTKTTIKPKLSPSTTPSTTKYTYFSNYSVATLATKPTVSPRITKSMWEKLQVSISPLTKEKIYVVTPQPWRVTPKEINEKLLLSATEASNIGTSAKFSVVIQPEGNNRTVEVKNGEKGGLHIVYSEWPHLINNLITTTTTERPKTPTTKHPLFGLMDLSSYTPPPNSTVETYGGHSRVITVVTPTSVTKKKNSGLKEKKTTAKSTTPLFSTVK